jgi:hypothetical protein
MESRKSGDDLSINTMIRGSRGGGRGRGDHQDQYRDHRYEYEQHNTMVMVAMTVSTMTNAMVAADMVGAGAMPAKTPKEIVSIMDLEPMILVKYAAMWVTLD